MVTLKQRSCGRTEAAGPRLEIIRQPFAKFDPRLVKTVHAPYKAATDGRIFIQCSQLSDSKGGGLRPADDTAWAIAGKLPVRVIGVFFASCQQFGLCQCDQACVIGALCGLVPALTAIENRPARYDWPDADIEKTVLGIGACLAPNQAAPVGKGACHQIVTLHFPVGPRPESGAIIGPELSQENFGSRLPKSAGFLPVR